VPSKFYITDGAYIEVTDDVEYDVCNSSDLPLLQSAINDYLVGMGYLNVSVSITEFTDPIFGPSAKLIASVDAPDGLWPMYIRIKRSSGSSPAFDQRFNFATQLASNTACDTCQEKVFSACQASYTIVAGLTASTEYTVVLTDRNEVRYTQAVTTDGSGDLTIDMTDIPSGLLTPESGGFLFEVYEDSGLTTKADITANGHIYGCIQLTFEHTTTTTNNL
jgi:hypothetical protein